jgi:ATP-dependent Clp protease ATP-binding subunit ClpB
MQVEIVAKRLEEKQITLTLTNAALEHLAKEGYNPQYGARPLKRLIQTKILTPIANMMVARGVMEGESVRNYLTSHNVGIGLRRFIKQRRARPLRSRSL